MSRFPYIIYGHVNNRKKVDRKGSDKVSQSNEARYQQIMNKCYIIKRPRSRLYRLWPC